MRLIVNHPDAIVLSQHEYDLDGKADVVLIIGDMKIAEVYDIRRTYKNRCKAYTQLDKNEEFIFDNFPNIQKVDKFFVYAKPGYGYMIERVYDD